MKVHNNQNHSIKFGATISKRTEAIKTAYSYMERCKDLKPPYANTKLELDLFNLVEKALKEHPSKESLRIERFLVKRDAYCWNERASINSNKATLRDVEPVRDDSIAGELGILRRILDPENKDQFITLTGITHAGEYQPWWDKHIAPIWNLINENFRENPRIFPEISDEIYNDCFRRQIDIYDYGKKPRQNIETKSEEKSKPSFVQRLKSAWQILKG